MPTNQHVKITDGSGVIGAAASALSFYGGTPVTKPSLTYSRTGETAAEAQIRAALAALGLVTDNTTA